MKPLPLVCSASLWECDPLLINLFLTMSGSGPDPQAHALFVFILSFLSELDTCQGRQFALSFFFSDVALQHKGVPFYYKGRLHLRKENVTFLTFRWLNLKKNDFTLPSSILPSPSNTPFTSPSLIPLPHTALLTVSVVVISWTLHYSFHSSVPLWSSLCESESCGACWLWKLQRIIPACGGWLPHCTICSP